MKKILFALIFPILLLPELTQAQLQKVIVEKYYVSDANDATDTICNGGHLPAGSVTYRVYIGLKPGYKLTKIYGDANHALKIKSDSLFFDNSQDGQSFG